MLPQVLEDLRNMLAMFGLAPGVDEDIVNVDHHEPMKELPEHLMHKVLEYGGGVGESIGHNEILVVTSRGHKGSLPFIPLTYPDEVISAAEVQLSEDGCTLEMFEGAGNEGKWIPEFDSDVIKSSVIYTGS